jgi:hypothetical protein
MKCFSTLDHYDQRIDLKSAVSLSYFFKLSCENFLNKNISKRSKREDGSVQFFFLYFKCRLWNHTSMQITQYLSKLYCTQSKLSKLEQDLNEICAFYKPIRPKEFKNFVVNLLEMKSFKFSKRVPIY